MRRPSLAVVLAACVLLIACGPASVAPATPTTPLTMPAIPPTATAAPIVAATAVTSVTASAASTPPLAGTPLPGASPTPLVGPRAITPADQGQTLRLAIGETVTLRLGEGSWEVQITDPRVLAPVPTATPAPGEQGVYQARAAGVTELVAVATPPCAKAQPPCRVLAPAFRLIVVVR